LCYFARRLRCPVLTVMERDAVNGLGIVALGWRLAPSRFQVGLGELHTLSRDKAKHNPSS